MNDWQESADNYAGSVHAKVREQHPDASIAEPNEGFYVFRRGSNIVQMSVQSAERQVYLNFVVDGLESPPQQTFAYDQHSIQEIANAIVEWLNFQRYRTRGL